MGARKHIQQWDKAKKRLDYAHRLIWEKHHGKIPEGYVVHHINFKQEDNRISNLKLMTSSEHNRFHSLNKTKETKVKMSNSMKKKYAHGELKSVFVKGHKPWNKDKKGYTLTAEHKRNVVLAIKKRLLAKRLPHSGDCYTCHKCLQLKHQDQFYKRKASWNGLSPRCKNCS